MSDARVKLFADCRCNLSEAPMWNDREQMLYWRGSHGELYRKAMTDAAGNVWVANCRPGEPLLCYDPAGQIIDEIDFPVRRVISVAFGGPDRTTLFVTTAHEGAPKGDHDGGVFRVNSPTPGAQEFRARL